MPGFLNSLNLPDPCRLHSKVLKAPWRVPEQIRLPIDVSGRRLEALILEELVHESEVKRHPSRQELERLLFPRVEVIPAI